MQVGEGGRQLALVGGKMVEVVVASAHDVEKFGTSLSEGIYGQSDLCIRSVCSTIAACTSAGGPIWSVCSTVAACTSAVGPIWSVCSTVAACTSAGGPYSEPQLGGNMVGCVYACFSLADGPMLNENV